MFQLKKKWIVCALASAIFLPGCGKDDGKSAVAGASMAGGDSGAGNGGGAISRDGNILTFGQSGVKVELLERLTDIPGISYLEQLIDKISISENVKGMLDKAVKPLGARRYYKIDEADLNPRKRAELLAQYERFIKQKIPGDQLVLLAVTIGKETFFLPDFFKLSDDKAKAVIVFHESLWVINKNLTLKTVLKAEVAVEQLLRSPLFQQPIIYDRELMQVLKDTFQDPYMGIVGAILYDFRAGPVTIRFPGHGGSLRPTAKTFQRPVFTLEELIGENSVMQTQNGSALDVNLVHGYFAAMQRLNPQLATYAELMAESEFAKLTKVSYQEQEEDRPSWACEDFGYNNWPWLTLSGYGEEKFDLSRPYAEASYGPINVRGMQGAGGTIGITSSMRAGDCLYKTKNQAMFLEFKH